MDQLSFLLVVLAERLFRPKHSVRLQILQAQIRFLRSRIDTSRIVPSPDEKHELLRLGALLCHDVADVMHIVQPETYRCWLRKKARGGAFKRSGRPRIDELLHGLILRLGMENVRWGYRRVVGELRKLGFYVSATTVRKVLREAGYPPSPKWGRNPLPIPWTTFIHAHAESIVACDFFSKKVHTLRGTLTAYVLVFIHLGSRRVYCSPATYSPNWEWVMQQNRNASMWMEDEGIAPRFILRDRDRKYPDGLKEFWKSSGTTCLKSPPKAPKANAFAESFIGTLKRECLNYFVCFSRDQLDYIVRTWVKHYNTERPHRGVGIGNNVLDASFTPEPLGTIRCKRQLGGIVTSYYRDAA